jgi:hypothetical protein
MDSASFLLHTLLARSPTLLLVAAGILFALIRWKRHPKVSLLTLLGLCFWQAESFAFLFIRHHLSDWAQAGGATPDGITRLYFALNLTQDFFYSAVLILLVAAAFSQRGHLITNDIE